MKNLYVYPKWKLGGHGRGEGGTAGGQGIHIWKLTEKGPFKTNELTCKLSKILLLTVILI